MKKSIYLFVCLLGLWGCFLFGRRSGEKPIQTIITRDTVLIVRVDTMVINKPQPYKVTVHDTVYFSNPQNTQNPQNPQPGEFLVHQTKIYQDSTYRAQVSGYDVQLDWIETYNKTIIREITRVEQIKTKPKRWGLGVQAGYGIGRNGLQPYIGVGISYNIISF